jgi:hypothetical protein
MPLAHFSSDLEPNEDALSVLKGARIVFVYADMADAFLARILPLLEQPIVLITHNSEAHIGQPHRAALDSPRIVHWFAQNVSLDHPKLTALPIGVANAQWKHGVPPRWPKWPAAILLNASASMLTSRSALTLRTRPWSIRASGTARLTEDGV